MAWRVKVRTDREDGSREYSHITGPVDRATAIALMNELIAEDKHYLILICDDGYVHRQQPRKDKRKPKFQLDPKRFTH